MNQPPRLTLLWTYLKILLGAALYAAGFQFFLYPNAIVSGGITGISMILNYLTQIPVGITAIVLNIPIFILGLIFIGGRFILRSLWGMMVSYVAIDLFALIPLDITQNPLLGAIFGGVLSGVGLGIVFSAGASTGGMDIVAKLVRRKLAYINMGQVMLGLDFAVILVFSLLFQRLEAGLYAIIAIYLSSKMVDVLLYGTKYAKAAYIVSEKSQEISQRITKELGRGATLLSGRGAFTGDEKSVIFCAIKNRQIVELKRLVKDCDEQAFMIILEAREVLGHGFELIDPNN